MIPGPTLDAAVHAKLGLPVGHTHVWVYHDDPIGDGYGAIRGWWCRLCNPKITPPDMPGSLRLNDPGDSPRTVLYTVLPYSMHVVHALGALDVKGAVWALSHGPSGYRCEIGNPEWLPYTGRGTTLAHAICEALLVLP